MRTVFNIERELVDILDGYAQKLEKKLAKINSYMKVRFGFGTEMQATPFFVGPIS